jgi:hypothetical protein
VKTGQLTTSFHPATGNPIMTSTTYNRYVAHATEENKIELVKELRGETQGLSRGRKGWAMRLLMGLNDLLPISIRPIKSKRAHRRRYLGLRHRLFVFRMHWKSHHKNKIKKLFNL